MAGRFAPSPTSGLHLGNLRTAMAAWLMARATGRAFRLRIEDLDTQRVAAAPGVAKAQMADLFALGLDFDGPVVWQSERLDAYAEVADALSGRLYECFCTRREIAQAASAPHGDGFRPYPGTCRDLTPSQRARLRRERPPAWRIRADDVPFTARDVWAGEVTGTVDDFVVRRNDGVWAYNLAVVVDDLAQGVDQVARGDDLLESAPRQAWLTSLLGGNPPIYAHVGLVSDSGDERLSKRRHSPTLAECRAHGHDTDAVRSALAASLGLAEPGEPVTMSQLLARFSPGEFDHGPWGFTPGAWPLAS